MSEIPYYLYDGYESNKIWGNTDVVFTCQRYSKHLLNIEKGGYCSLHYHTHRSNEFVVKTGNLEIIEFYGPEKKHHILTDGNKLVVPSLVPHLFYAHEETVACEEYFPDRGGIVDDSDIVRLTLGGKDTYMAMMDKLCKRFNNTIRS